MDIVNYIDMEQLTLKVNLNDKFPGNVKNKDENLQEIIQLKYISPNETKIISSMVGWGKGKDWEKSHEFFVLVNIYTYEEMLKLYNKQ